MSAYSITFLHPPGESQPVDWTKDPLETIDFVEQKIKVGTDEVILDAALDFGVDLPYSCLNSKCTECVGRLVKGHVEQSPEAIEFLDRYDIDRDFVLLCACRPTTDCVIVTHQAEAAL